MEHLKYATLLDFLVRVEYLKMNTKYVEEHFVDLKDLFFKWYLELRSLYSYLVGIKKENLLLIER